jgi:AMMECR1 domain-containing protein
MEDLLLDIAICSGLGIPYFKQDVSNSIPNNSFGVFVTVRRYQKLNKWPEDIHGCIGYWDNNYNNLSKEQLLENMTRVSYDATWNDSRKSYFKRPVYEDALTTYEIDFMLNPIYSVNENGILSNGDVFNNNKYGLIVVSGNRRATYLPNVFPDKKWEYIRDSLIKKGNAKNKPTFFAYKVKLYSKKLYELINKNYSSLVINSFQLFIKSKYKDFIPYEVINNKNRTNKEQYVRNIATINDILSTGLILRDKMINNLDYYKKKYQDNKTLMRQASSFLIRAYSKLGIEKDFIKEVCDYLYGSLSNLEPRFELGEVLISLVECCPNQNVLRNEQRKMYASLINKKNSSTDNIFEYNWQSKFLYYLYKNNINKNSRNSSSYNHAIELSNRIITITSSFDESNETNYIAVGFEALCSLYHLIPKKDETLNQIIKLFYLLQKRFSNGLYYFNNKTARLDITGHVINGLLAFIFS